jgi:hypothetical protein
MSLNDIIDFILNCMYVNIRKGMLLSRTNYVMMSNIMLMFLILLFLAGDVENNPGPMGTPVSENVNIIFIIQYNTTTTRVSVFPDWEFQILHI